MTIQYEKTKATLELLKLDIKSYVEKLEDVLEEITLREKSIKEHLDRRSTNDRPESIQRPA